MLCLLLYAALHQAGHCCVALCFAFLADIASGLSHAGALPQGLTPVPFVGGLMAVLVLPMPRVPLQRSVDPLNPSHSSP